MPKAESPKHPKASEDPTRPVSPHRVAIPPTPAAAPRSDPIDSVRKTPSTSPKKSLEKDKENGPKEPAAPASRAARAASAAPETKPETKPEPTSPATAVKSAQPGAGNKDATSPAKPVIDMEIFGQILELDDEEDEDKFSKSVILDYFKQVEATFADMDQSIEAKDLPKLSNLGHYLKGSSAALGVAKVQATCEDIQNVGKRKLAGDKPASLTEEEALERLKKLKSQAEQEYKEAKAWLKSYAPGTGGA